MATLLSFLLSLFGKVKVYLGLAATGAVGLLFLYLNIRKSGEDAVLAEQATKRAELQKKYDKIDNRKPDLDGAVSYLRKRSIKL